MFVLVQCHLLMVLKQFFEKQPVHLVAKTGVDFFVV